MVRARVFVSGRVQGVFFRATAAAEARSRRVAGWARNLPDGRVEAVFQGPQDAVAGMIAWCREGPPGARVADVEVGWETPDPGLSGFDARW